MISWMEWPGDSTGKIAEGAVAQTRQQIGNEVMTTSCTMTNIVADDGAGDVFRYRSGSWQGDALDDLYNIGGTGGNNQLVAGISNGQNPRNPGTMSFHVACEADVDGRPYPMQGLVFADAEQNNYQPNGQQESISATPDNPDDVTWRIMERTRTPGCNTGTWVSRYDDERLRMMSTTDQCSGSPGGPIVVSMMENVESATFSLWSNNGAVSALAIGVVHFADFGDAPESYGNAGALSSGMFQGGELPMGHTQAFGSAPADTTLAQPTPRLGDRLDPEANQRFSPDARGDDQNGADDEDSIVIPASLEAKRGQPFTSPEIKCVGPGDVAGWIDWNGNGTFDEGERSNTVACGEGEETITLDWRVPGDATVGASTTFMRLRIADPGEAFGATGTTFSGEVEDYQVQTQVEDAPIANDDRSDEHEVGETVTIPVLDNDTGNLDPSTVNLVDPDSGEPVKELTVPGEGVWTVNEDGSVTFVPEDGYTGDPTPVAYTAEDPDGEQVTANIIVTYLPEAYDDESLNNPRGEPVTVDVLGNDEGEFDPSTVNITDPESGEPVKELTVPGEGVWTVNDDGSITFTPEEGFEGDPTPIGYTVEDEAGTVSSAEVVVTYVDEATPPAANDDESLDNESGTAVRVPVLSNDEGALLPSTVNITDPDSGEPVKELAVPGEGTWTVDPETGDITFTPEEGYEGDPTPIAYTVEDADGNEVTANVVVTYLDADAPVANDDESLDNPLGEPVTVNVLENDEGDYDPSTVNISDPEGNPVKELVVPGEGVWTVNDDGSITFTPEDGFEGDPTPITYTVEDSNGNQDSAGVVVTYVDPDAPAATDDESLNNEPGSTVTVDPLANDSGDLDPTTVNLTDPDGNPVKELTVPGEGVWTV
ncbi:CshA/CshB family fibrillar adhesin-related protein, partial [Brevibacterium sp.]|uniref:CshA/CshB family fibrillar adhesin-related protein n=1 Tax=Brevibacterium sp. TaxID=1701 RepID=UPI0025C030DF